MAEPTAGEGTSATPSPLRIYFVPLPSPGHVIPMVDIAKLFACRGADATVVLTPLNASRFSSSAARAGLRLHVLRFPAAEAGLPAGCESADVLPYRSLSGHFSRALDLLKDPFDCLLRRQLPDAVVADALLSWAATTAAEHGVPLYAFTGAGCFSLSVDRSLQSNRPHDLVNSGSDHFLVPGLPDRVCLTRTKLTETTIAGSDVREFLERAKDADRLTAGYVVNTFPELEPGYVPHYEREAGRAVFALGPVSLVDGAAEDGAERGRGPATAGEAKRVLGWLDSRPEKSVVYVCFGSLTRFPVSQVEEIGLGLLLAGVPFVWVVAEDSPVAGRVEREAEGWGLVVRGWAPQAALLGHATVGGFLTHCGWGAATEAAAAGVPVLTWPVFGEQFYNEEVMVAVVGTGAKMGAERGFRWGEEERGGVVVGRERVAERVRWFMGESGEMKEIRRRAREMGEKARRAVAEGGSSWLAVGQMMEDIRRGRQRSSPEQKEDEEGGEGGGGGGGR